MWPLLIPIEIISYLSRPISLSVRLFANMLAGHTLLKVIAGFIAALGVFGVLPLALLVALTGLEILIAFLQAYVFAILTCLYINAGSGSFKFIVIGSIFSSFIVAVGRNPAARGEVFTMTMLGFALVEAIALFALVIALIILFG